MTTPHTLRRRAAPCLLAVLACCLMAAPVSAKAAGAISQGFNTEDKVVVGSLMDLKNDSQNDAELADSDRAAQLLGVVGDQPLIALSDGNTQVQVVTNGLTTVLVSDINGAIHNGDPITASPIDGVGMKATTATTIIGTAQGNLSKSGNVSTKTLTDNSGQQHTVTIGSVPVLVNVRYYAANADQLSPLVPGFLQSVGNSIAGHNVSSARVLAAGLALVLGFSTAIIMLYSSIRSGVTAIGRNPLAQAALRKGIGEVLLIASGVLLVTLLLLYIILTA